MKKLLLISLAVLLALSLGITMVPPQSVEASPSGGTTFNITAKGQGDYRIGSSESGTGEFSFSVAGQARQKSTQGKGWGYPPQAEVGGHISGSFDGHKISLGLQGNQAQFDFSWNGKPRLIYLGGLRVRGTYDGEPFNTGGGASRVAVDEDGKTIEVLLSIPYGPPPIYIFMYETGPKAADIFKVKIREVGN